jgi:hypothetical protein
MVLAVIELEYRVPTFEVVPRNEARGLELRQHSIHGRKADLFAGIQQILVNIFSTEMPVVCTLEYFQDLRNS